MINELREHKDKIETEDQLWHCFVEYQQHPFYTFSGLPFQYTIKIGKNGEYTKEIIINRREGSKTLTWSSVVLAFHNALRFEGVVPRPKASGDIPGISYIYPIFYKLGIIQVPDSARLKMDGHAGE